MTQPAVSAPSAPAAPASSAPQNPSAPAGGAPPAPPESALPWLEGAPPDLVEWAGQQGFKTPADALASQRGLMRMKGVPPDQLMRLEPGWEADPEKSAAVYARWGRPEKPEGYEIPDIPVGEGDTNLADGFRQWAFEEGLSARQAKGVATKYQAALQEFAQKRAEGLALRNQQEEVALRAEWGGAFDENDANAGRAIETMTKAVGLETRDFQALRDAWGFGKAMKFFAAIGRAFGEDAPAGGERDTGFGMTPAAANKRADELTAQQMKMDRSDPGYHALGEEILRYRHLATGEQQRMGFGRDRNGA